MDEVADTTRRSVLWPLDASDLGIGFAYYGEATAGGVIALVAVAIYVGTIVLDKALQLTGENATPEIDNIAPVDSQTPSD